MLSTDEVLHELMERLLSDTTSWFSFFHDTDGGGVPLKAQLRVAEAPLLSVMAVGGEMVILGIAEEEQNEDPPSHPIL